MNPINRTPTETLGAIQYTRALSTRRADGEPPTSLVKTQAFRVPWVALKRGDQPSPPEVAARERVGDQPVGTADSTPVTKDHNAFLTLPEEGTVESSEFILEELRRRSEAKTFLMEEALQRSEWSQRRFWGINE